MVIHWVNVNKKASIGDLKVYDCGKTLIRANYTVRGVPALSRGKAMLHWYDINSPIVAELKKKLESGSIKHEKTS